jgi:hypothetical protein
MPPLKRRQYFLCRWNSANAFAQQLLCGRTVITLNIAFNLRGGSGDDVHCLELDDFNFQHYVRFSFLKWYAIGNTRLRIALNCHSQRYSDESKKYAEISRNVQEFLEDKGFSDIYVTDDYKLKPDGTLAPAYFAHKKINAGGRAYTLLVVQRLGTLDHKSPHATVIHIGDKVVRVMILATHSNKHSPLTKEATA